MTRRKAGAEAPAYAGVTMRAFRSFAVLTLAALAAAASAQPAPSRGELLYANHCVGCHNQKMHWRDQRQATDWDSLKALVAAWQAREKLAWTDDDVQEVARHLNETIYRFPRPGAPVALLPLR